MADSQALPPKLLEVPISARPPTSFEGVAEQDVYARFITACDAAREAFRGRVVWNVNSTAQGGGVAEMLRPLLGYVRGAGVDARWVVIHGDPAFFRITKRLHNRLHGDMGDGGPLGPAEMETYLSTLKPNLEALVSRLHPQDIVLLHDPQTAGLVEGVRATGAAVIWRCHIGIDTPNDVALAAQQWLAPCIADANAYVFSCDEHVWGVLDRSRVSIIAPSIDAFAPKNYDLTPESVVGILAAGNVISDHTGLPPDFVRSDGSPGRVDLRADAVGGVVPRGVPLVLQVSRWDRLKDPLGVLTGFVDHVAPQSSNAHLALVGPEVVGVSDDPEGAQVLAEVTERWQTLPDAARRRVHLISLPMSDPEVNAVMVNAAQRYASVVVQKSIAEGFGLTVAEAMWKSRPVVASAVGGIKEQIDDGVNGVLVDARDLAAYGQAVAALLVDPERAAAMGAQAREQVRRHFLGPRHLLQYFELLHSL